MSDLDLPSTPPAPLEGSRASPPASPPSFTPLHFECSTPSTKRARDAGYDSDGATSQPSSLRRKVDEMPEVLPSSNGCFMIPLLESLHPSSSQNDLREAVRVQRKATGAVWWALGMRPSLKLAHYDYQLLRDGSWVLCILNKDGEEAKRTQDEELASKVAKKKSAEFLREEQLREEAEAKDKELQALRSAIAESDGKLRTFETDLVFRQTYEHGTRALQTLHAAKPSLPEKYIQHGRNVAIFAYQIRTPAGGAPFLPPKMQGGIVTKAAEGEPITIDPSNPNHAWMVLFDEGLTIVEQTEPVIVKAAQHAVWVMDKYGDDRHTTAHPNFDKAFVEDASLHIGYSSPFQLSETERKQHLALMSTIKIHRNPLRRKNPMQLALDP